MIYTMEGEIMDKRIKWDQYFMMQAVLLASRSTCERLSVGAVIVRDKRIIAGGYNGSVAVMITVSTLAVT